MKEDELDDFLDKFNWIDRVQGLVWGILRSPYRKSHKGHKEKKLRIDAGNCEIHVLRSANSGAEAEAILAEAHIPIAGKRITGKEAIFIVKARQGAIAEYRLLRAGIVLGPEHTLIEPRNVGWAAGKGKMPVDFQQSQLAGDEPKQAIAKPQPQRRRKSKPQRKRLRILDWFDL